jgi:hypothetical protein
MQVHDAQRRPARQRLAVCPDARGLLAEVGLQFRQDRQGSLLAQLQADRRQRPSIGGVLLLGRQVLGLALDLVEPPDVAQNGVGPRRVGVDAVVELPSRVRLMPSSA